MEERLLRLDYEEGSEMPYKASYVNWQTAPIHPRLGLGGRTGDNSRTYGFMMRAVLKDLMCLNDDELPGTVLTASFRNAVGKKVEDLTLNLLSRDILTKLRNKESELDELIRVL